ncbi:glycosyl transferase group 1, partial [bacterium]|nr:glycosyl transferase group 1 [candidate division CSSED10-310 bacterium]
MSNKRIAIFSPVSPIRSGISDYTEKLLDLLKQHYAIDLFVDGYQPNLRIVNQEIAIFNRRDFEWRQRLNDYYSIIYQLGNHVSNTYMYPVLFRHPGIVVLHDA